jgi:multidrug/hemolysin transport system permease protein
MAILVRRNLTVYLRDRSGVFLSLLSAVILFVLYTFFLGNMQVNFLSQKLPEASRSDAQNFITAWMFSGITMITTVTTSLGAGSIFIDDRTSRSFKDFLVAPVRRSQLTAGYVLTSLIVAFAAGMLILLVAAVYIWAAGGPAPGFKAIARCGYFLLLMAAAFSALSIFLVSLLSSSAGFSSLSAIVGTLVGFLSGSYIPVGALPGGVADVLNALPFSGAATLLRNELTPKSTAALTGGDPGGTQFLRDYYGVTAQVGGHSLGTLRIVGLLVITFLIFLMLAVDRVRGRMR